MKISDRLQALTFFVPYNSKVIDVGTDHALLPIYLIENDLVCNPVIASDNKYGPLDAAKKNIEAYNLQNKITICLSDGLKEIEADYVGFTIPNEFVVGYGLDFNQKYRNLPYVGVLKEECYK